MNKMRVMLVLVAVAGPNLPPQAVVRVQARGLLGD